MKTKYISRLLFISNISNIYGGLIMVKGIMDYYAFLNVDRDADKKTIKKAYRNFSIYLGFYRCNVFICFIYFSSYYICS